MNILESIREAILGSDVAAASVSQAAGGNNIALDPTSGMLGLTGEQIVAVCSSKEANSPEKLHWQTSVVDLMKVFGIEPSLSNRLQLAQEVGYQGDVEDSGNVGLHGAVMRKLLESGK